MELMLAEDFMFGVSMVESLWDAVNETYPILVAIEVGVAIMFSVIAVKWIINRIGR